VALGAAVAALAWWLPGAAVFIGLLSLLVFLHEGGHYLVARRAGMRPTEFFVGFGPTIWARTSRDGLRWGIKAIPAGGYVKIPGMGPREEVEASMEPYTYRAATRPRRLAVILAGVAVNLLVAVLLFSTQALLSAEPGVGPVTALGDGVSMTAEVLDATVDGLAGLVTGVGDYAGSVVAGEVPEHRMMSPIGGAQLTDGILEDDPSNLLLLTGVFSASLALLNLIPLLPLDGGHGALVVAEGALARLRRRPKLRLDPNRFTPVAVAVLVALLALSATSAYLDVLHPLSTG
jgi:membrane-associated protease RseP (regulator of RpoE activity)